jgi:hypothetical protein
MLLLLLASTYAQPLPAVTGAAASATAAQLHSPLAAARGDTKVATGCSMLPD